MPVYSYTCDKCGDDREEIVKYENRDSKRLRCPGACGGTLIRHGVERINLGRGRYQCAVVTSSGETVKGNFGGGYRTDSKKRADGRKK
jgi:putative FmdB family regulatory protein